MLNKFILIIVLTFSTSVFSQYIKVTPEGLRDVNLKPYIVLDFPGKSAAELFESSLLFVNERFQNPKEVIASEITNKKLRFSEHTTMRVTNGGVKVTVNITYDIDLDFKEGRVKYEIVNLDMGAFAFKGSIWKTYPIWNEKNGKLRLEEEKNELEELFNKGISLYVNSINNESDW